MSRPISITSSATVNIASYSGNTSYVTTGTTYPPSNGINSSANTSNYAAISATSTSSGFAYYSFASIDIPSIATINSVSCTVRTRASATSSGTSSFQLFAGSTGKGSQTTVTSTTVTTYNLASGTSWTAQEINNGISLRIGVRRASAQRAYSNRFYGATLTVNYSVNGMAYEVIAESTYTGATVSPATQEVMSGESATVAIFPDDINNIVVEDNGSDVTNQLQYVTPTPGTQTFTSIPTSYDAADSTYDGIYTGTTESGLSDQDSNDRICVYANTAANSISKLTYNFDCSSIPANATITSVSCIAAASCYSNGQYFDTRVIQLYNGSVAKGNATTITGNGSTKAKHNIDGGSWTRNELNDIKIVLYIQRGNNTTQASFSFWGATLTVNYTLPADPYYAYTITNIDADHDVIVSESIIVPPEEDPEKTYYSVTISSINAITDPERGTTRVESGTGQTITITPSDPQITLALDNGVDISNQLVSHGGGSPTSALTAVQGASYGFAYCGTTGYYMSQNKGVDKSAAVCKVDFDLPVRCLVTIEFINYAEASYDFGVFGNIDTPLSNDYYVAGSGGATITDSSYKLACNTSSYNTATAHTLTYEIEAGEHSVYIKYSKDDATSSNNDTLQFKVTNIETLEPSVGYYTYDLSNINANHSLVFIFGDVTYYFVTSSTDSNAKLYPDGQMVQLPGDTYRLTVVPEDTGDTVSVRDNNIDVTSSLVRKEEVIEKGGVQKTIVNYIYVLSNIQTAHTVTVSSISPGDTPFIKVNGSWTGLTGIWKKIDGEWEQQKPISSDIFDDGTIYIKGN